LGIKQDPISKITNTKMAGGVAQVIEHLIIKPEALTSTPSTTNKQTKRRRKRGSLWCVKFRQMKTHCIH
jgi:hypothetical protein